MAEIRTVTTLRSKRDEIADAIKRYEKLLEQARADLAHVNAVIRLFAASDDPKDMPKYADVHRLFKRDEKWTICEAALAEHGDMTTKELAFEVMKAKGLDANDPALVAAMTLQLAQILKRQARRGRVAAAGKRDRVCVWRTEGA